MAAIDKTYTKSWEEYKEYQDWAIGKSFTCPNGDIVRPITYLRNLKEEDFDGEKYIPIMNTSYAVDYFLIKYCPIQFIRERMKEVYSQDYVDDILNGVSAWDTFSKEGRYGTRFKITKYPKYERSNRPYKKPCWFIQLKNSFISYDEGSNRWIWDYELSEPKGWTSNTAEIKTIKALKRCIRKWKLPKGTIVQAIGGYVGEDYEFLIY